MDFLVIIELFPLSATTAVLQPTSEYRLKVAVYAGDHVSLAQKRSPPTILLVGKLG